MSKEILALELINITNTDTIINKLFEDMLSYSKRHIPVFYSVFTPVYNNVIMIIPFSYVIKTSYSNYSYISYYWYGNNIDAEIEVDTQKIHEIAMRYMKWSENNIIPRIVFVNTTNDVPTQDIYKCFKKYKISPIYIDFISEEYDEYDKDIIKSIISCF